MNPLASQAAALAGQITAWRRDFHQHPEVGFQEVRTASVIAAELRALGLEVRTGVGQTGVVGLLEGATEGPTVLIRCDMDALSILEENDVPYASTVPGCMHACGHDGHMAIGLGVATLLAAHQGRMRGRVKFVFQPAEEPMGGAQAMIEDGALDAPSPDVALGLHLWNGLPLGRVAVTTGPVMAGAETFAIQIDGHGGHAGLPHETRDPVVAAAHVVAALQSAVSRNLDPLEAAVLSVTGLQTGTAANAVPMSARLSGTIRTFTPPTRELLLDRLETIATGVAGALGCAARVEVAQEARPVVNDPAVAARVRQVAADLWGETALAEGYRTTAAEDMAYFLERVPGCYVLLGAANAERGLDFPHHHPRFDFDETALIHGAALLACAAATYLLPQEGA